MITSIFVNLQQNKRQYIIMKNITCTFIIVSICLVNTIKAQNSIRNCEKDINLLTAKIFEQKLQIDSILEISKINKLKNTEIQALKSKIFELKNENKRLKDIIVNEDFANKNINSSEIIIAYEKSKSYNLQNLLSNKIYTIQIGVFMNKNNKFNNDIDIWHIKLDSGSYIYFLGHFTSLNDAKNRLLSIKKSGYYDSFIIQLNN